ncbi:MAG: polysaccharide deacetylase, partial [Alcaligenaceae bacterium]|nr:polysaccharide deacetylase [Alcaligenaceae bacterium]
LGSVTFFKHLIYVCLIAVMLAGLYGIYYLIDNVLIDYIKNWIDSSIDIYHIQPTQESKPDVQAEPGVENKGSHTGMLKETYAKTDLMSGRADTWNGQTESWNALEKVNQIGFNNDAKDDFQVEKANFTIDYQNKYPGLYCKPSSGYIHREKVAYLTFDDGPSSRTPEILDILKEYNIKATFFVVTSNTNTSLLKRIAEEGHTIGIHTNSHVYKEIYSSVEAFLDDFNTAYKKVYEETGIKAEIFRFPGGSLNAYNLGTYQEIISEMLRRGFQYYDWNISTNDSNPRINANEIVNVVKNSVKGQNKLIVLCHDSEHKYETVKALPEIIEFLKNEGYSFDKLDNTVEPVVFSYR